MKIKKSELDLIARLFNETENNGREMMKDIIHNDEKSRHDFERYLELWERSADVKDLDKIDEGKDWEKVRAQMNFSSSKKINKPSILFIRVAAILLLALGLGFLMVQYLKVKEPASEYFETASLGSKKELVLSDGSKIHLNMHSKIIRNSGYGKVNRDIILEGEAFFEVAKNPNVPFKVYTKNSTIEVTGTSFNIKSDTIQVIVGVVTGKVAFYQTGNKLNRIDLTPERSGYYQTHSNSFKYESLDPNSVAWHTGRLIFRKTPVGEAFKVIAGYFNKELVIEPGTPVNEPLSTEFDKQSLNEMIDVINSTLLERVDIVTTDTRIIIKKR